jgi:hypothetical protein
VVYLSENEVGFDPTDIGFPTIRGCHAILYVTAGGLFGIHNYGGDNPAQFQERAAVFRDFVLASISTEPYSPIISRRFSQGFR